MTAERRGVAFALCLVPFVVLATLNSGGYRYGASDQAFYQPAVLKQLDPALFPRDTVVLATQTHLTTVDEIVAGLVRASGASVPVTFAVLYALALVIFAWGVWHIAQHLYETRWAAVALLAAVSLRHAIARSGTNTLEGYFHPRMLAYALGAAAITSFLRGRLGLTLATLIAAAAVHPTTALWFAVWLAAAAALEFPRLRKWLVVSGLTIAAMAAWALIAGPLAGRLSVMDSEWRRMLVTKDYLFPLEWPAYAWIVNLGYLPIIIWLYRRRRQSGLLAPRERALALGSASLAAIFLGALLLQAVGVTLVFQLQPARVFWMFDFLATIYAVWFLAEGRFFRLKAEATGDITDNPTGDITDSPVASAFRRKETRRSLVAAMVLTSLSMTRGIYVLVEAARPPVQISIRDDDWGRVMAWARTSDRGSGWLADPRHAVLYGTSLRVAGERDVFVEAVKDAAMGMYDRRIAVRTDERLRAVADFEKLTAAEARRLGEQYDLAFMVTEQLLDLPLAFESGPLHVYRLR